jgi:hypothetical protein
VFVSIFWGFVERNKITVPQDEWKKSVLGRDLLYMVILISIINILYELGEEGDISKDNMWYLLY